MGGGRTWRFECMNIRATYIVRFKKFYFYLTGE